MPDRKGSVVWFRQDLRLSDNPALLAAVQRGGPVVPVFVWAPEEEGQWPPGAASRWWLHQSLKQLDASLRRIGSRLILRRGPSLDALRDVLQSTATDSVFWNRRYEPEAIQRDNLVKAALQKEGYLARSFNASLLFEPWLIQTQQGRPYQVFTPFWKACLAVGAVDAPQPAPTRLQAPRQWPATLALAELKLEPEVDWAQGMRQAWQPGEHGAQERFARFMEEALSDYPLARDRPDRQGTSQLSAHLHFGEISVRQVWHALHEPLRGKRRPRTADAVETYARELGWREFACHLLYHFPETPHEPLRKPFLAFPWQVNSHHVRAWQRGRTGYPIVDAGMRQLWRIGWMHNRVRMVVASFLVKHLLIPWQEGARWFWDTLVDADLANNTLGWQWSAGCGADAAPYFRIFNPVLQAKKFDPCGAYVRRWVPELARLPDNWIHQPWAAPSDVLATACVQLGSNYPIPIVEHHTARMRALDAFRQIRP